MNTIYDIVLNFGKGNDVYEFFEWNKNDSFTYIEEIPIIILSSSMMDTIIRYSIQVSKSFLKRIHHKTISFHETIPYMALFADRTRVIAVTFNEEGLSIQKSYLLLEEEEEVLRESEDFLEESFSYKKLDSCFKKSFLTRREREIQDYLLQEIKHLWITKKYDEIHYLYQEISTLECDVEEEYSFLMDNVSNHFLDIYLSLYDIIQLTKEK